MLSCKLAKTANLPDLSHRFLQFSPFFMVSMKNAISNLRCAVVFLVGIRLKNMVNLKLIAWIITRILTLFYLAFILLS
jgi:DNA integrity scanning protein DisA with diadenylate cyclase activity